MAGSICQLVTGVLGGVANLRVTKQVWVGVPVDLAFLKVYKKELLGIQGYNRVYIFLVLVNHRVQVKYGFKEEAQGQCHPSGCCPKRQWQGLHCQGSGCQEDCQYSGRKEKV